MAVSGFVFTLRGPLRAGGDYASDFAAPYVSARLWLHHQNPYNSELFWETWHNAGALTQDAGGNRVYANPSSTHSVYPPPSLVALSPFALLSWPLAWKTLIALGAGLYLAAILLLARLLPHSWSDPFKPAFLAFALLLAPTLSAFHTSNVTSLSASLLLFAVYLLLAPACGNRAVISSIRSSNAIAAAEYSPASSLCIALLLALSLSIKPTLAPFALLYLIALRLWRTLFTTLGTIAALTASFFLRHPDPGWLASFFGNVNFLFTAGVASLAEQNLTRSDRIDLQLPLYTLTHSRDIASITAAVITLILLSQWLRSTNRQILQPPARDGYPALLDLHILSLSTLLVLGLLPFYQRFYSAMILLLPACWALRNLARPLARWILAVCCVFLANTSVLPRRLGVHIPPAGPTHLLLESLLTPHLCWLLLALSLLLLRALHSNTEILSPESAPPSPTQP